MSEYMNNNLKKQTDAINDLLRSLARVEMKCYYVETEKTAYNLLLVKELLDQAIDSQRSSDNYEDDARHA
tara:strand:+ start:750 stop:959 length:210 start_codon:yes stop_codon:yes gene_type:complete